jgi:hypothetical protein
MASSRISSSSSYIKTFKINGKASRASKENRTSLPKFVSEHEEGIFVKYLSERFLSEHDEIFSVKYFHPQAGYPEGISRDIFPNGTCG